MRKILGIKAPNIDQNMVHDYQLCQYYNTIKNIIEQGPGFNHLVLKWMLDTTQSKNLPKYGYRERLISDKTAIQPDLQIDNKGGGYKLVGSTNYGQDGNNNSVILASSGMTEYHRQLQLVYYNWSTLCIPDINSSLQTSPVQAEAYHLSSFGILST